MYVRTRVSERTRADLSDVGDRGRDQTGCFGPSARRQLFYFIHATGLLRVSHPFQYFVREMSS